jgi:hypothetical protein
MNLCSRWVVACLLLGLCLDEVVCHHFWRVDRGVSGSACAFCKHRLLSLASFHPPNLLIHRSLLGGRALVVLCCASPLRWRVRARLWFHDGKNVAGIPCYVVGALPRHSSSQGGCSVRCEKSLPLFESLFSVGRWLEARVACALYVSRSARGNRQWDG